MCIPGFTQRTAAIPDQMIGLVVLSDSQKRLFFTGLLHKHLCVTDELRELE
jgi:hypothetical protein